LNEDKGEVAVFGASGAEATEAVKAIVSAAPSIKVFGATDGVFWGLDFG